MKLEFIFYFSLLSTLTHFTSEQKLLLLQFLTPVSELVLEERIWKCKQNSAHGVNATDSEFGTNGSERVICPYPSTGPGGNDTLSPLYLSVSGNDTSDVFGHWWSKTNTVPLYLIVLLLPLLCFRSASFFARFTFLGTISVVYLIVLVTIKTSRIGFHLNFHWFDPSEFYVPEFRLLFPQLTGVLTLAFFIHNCVITLMKSNKNQENNVRDLSVAYLLVGLTYLYVGVLIFAAFPSPPLSKDCIEANFLDNYPSSDVLVFVARGFLLFQMITVYPLLGYLVRVQLMGQIFGNHYPSFFHVLALNILIVGAGVLMAKFYPNIGSIIRRRSLTQDITMSLVSRRSLTQDITMSLDSRRSLTQDVLMSLVSRRSLTQDITMSLDSRRSLTQDILMSLVSRRSLTQDITMSLVSRRSLTQDVPR
ncbi:unnamed protein product [Pleuronectes platessa]|uniref:Neutral amino acid transporter 9 n=1 Tax=Pleuronectes platessa TaxID=8262 RepID=A0A9N7YAU0_PLEPL|nr:unnamed protein product [Pleuronectes platessa]